MVTKYIVCFTLCSVVQCADDFLTGRLWKLFGVEIQINTVDGINKNALCILMASANYRLHKEVVGGASP